MKDASANTRTRRTITLLILNGALVLLLGCLAGIGFSAAIDAAGLHHDMVPGTAKAWHMAHMECLLNGLLLLACVPAFSYLWLSARLEKVIFWGLVVTGWTNGIGSTISALTGGTGNDGITGLDWNTLNFFIFSAGIVGVLAALIALVIACRSMLKQLQSSPPTP